MELLLVAIATLVVVVLVVLALSLYYLLKVKEPHQHDWKRENAARYESIMGPRTIIGYRCTSCGAIQTDNIKGDWT